MEELLRVERDGASNSSSSSQALAVRAESRIAKAVTPMKFWFMDEIVTDGVGHWRTYGPRGQVKGGRWKKGVKGVKNERTLLGFERFNHG